MFQSKPFLLPCFFVVITTFFSCSNQVHPYLSSTNLIKDFNFHLVNDSLNMHLRTPADINFFSSKKELKKALKKHEVNLNNVLFGGVSNMSPYYVFFMSLNGNKTLKSKNKFFQLDTLLHGQQVRFVIRPLDKDTFSYKVDAKAMLNNLTLDSSYKQKIIPINDLLFKHNKSNKFYQALTELGAYPTYNESDKQLQLQLQLSYASFMGLNQKYEELLQEWEANFVADTLVEDVILKEGIQGLEAVKKTIVEEAKKHSLVLFNENHFYPNHRKIVLELLADLKGLGFNYLAMEGLFVDSLLNQGKALDLQTGFYTREPIFGDLIRTAQGLGFEFVSYESDDSFSNREEGQAEKLYSKTFQKDSSAKLLVLAGVSHIFESPDQREKKWMAAILKEKYQLDPLTINQTSLNHYRKKVEEIVLIPSNKLNQEYYQTTDWQLVNNLSIQEPKGNFEYKNEFKEGVQIALFDKSELGKQQWIFDKVPAKSFYLPKGAMYQTDLPMKDYLLVIFDAKGTVLKKETAILKS